MRPVRQIARGVRCGAPGYAFSPDAVRHMAEATRDSIYRGPDPNACSSLDIPRPTCRLAALSESAPAATG